MEKVDALIEALAEHISDVIASGKECEGEISEKTKALAELISARANVLQLLIVSISFNSINDCIEERG